MADDTPASLAADIRSLADRVAALAVAAPPPPPAPTYLLTAIAATDEGAIFSVVLKTTGVAAGDLVHYLVTGVDADDLMRGEIDGSFLIDADGMGTTLFWLKPDQTTEGAETFTLTLDGNLGSISVDIGDISTTPPIPSPTYELSVGGSAAEGDTITFALQTTQVAANTVLGYTVSGIDVADLTSGSLVGTFVIDAAGMAAVNFELKADLFSEGLETMTLTLKGDLASISVLIEDTSVTPVVPTYALTASATTVDEGSSVTFALQTTDVAAGTSIGYTLSGVSASDVTGPLTGNLVLASNGSASVAVALRADVTTEGVETLRCSLAGSLGFVTTTVRDTSLTPGGPIVGNPYWVLGGATVGAVGAKTYAGRIDLRGAPVVPESYTLTSIPPATFDPPGGTIAPNGAAYIYIIPNVPGLHKIYATSRLPAVLPITFTAIPVAVPGPPGFLEAKGNNIGSSNFHGPSDWIDPTKLPAPVPWQVYLDPVTKTFGKPMNGAMPTSYESWHILGLIPVLYHGIPGLDADGKWMNFYPQLGDDAMANIIPGLKLKTSVIRGGPRGIGTMNPYTTWHGHPHVGMSADGTAIDESVLSTNPRQPWWVGIVMNGQIGFIMRDGSVSYPFQVQLESYSYDFSFDRLDPSVQYVVDTLVGKIIKVTHRLLGLPQSHELTFTQELWAEGFGRATSLRVIRTKLYVVNTTLGQVWEVDIPTKERRLVCTIPGAWFVDYTSTGKLVINCSSRAVHVVDPVTGIVGPNLQLPSLTGGAWLWVQCDVDRAGTCGPVDSIITLSSHGAGNLDTYRIGINGERMGFIAGGSGPGVMNVGPTQFCQESQGHYPWLGLFHPHDPCMMFQGFSNTCPSIIVALGSGHPWPARAPYDHARAQRGQQMIKYGGEAKDIAKVPSFTALMSPQGWSYLGCTSDYITTGPDIAAPWSYQDAAAFVRKGMIGNVPRTIAAEPMRDLLWFLYYNSQRHLLEGKPLIDGLLAANLDAPG